MKNSIFKIVFIAFLFVMLSCSSNDDNNVNANDDGTFLTAKVDGVDLEVRALLFAIDAGSITEMSADLEDGSKSIIMALNNLNRTGTYPMYDETIHDIFTTSYHSVFIYGEGEDLWLTSFEDNASSSLTITALDEFFVEGTFQFTGFNADNNTEKRITEGRFRFKRISI